MQTVVETEQLEVKETGESGAAVEVQVTVEEKVTVEEQVTVEKEETTAEEEGQ